jgi:RNA polymerase sigma-70 factor (ECF subfamily)
MGAVLSPESSTLEVQVSVPCVIPSDGEQGSSTLESQESNSGEERQKREANLKLLDDFINLRGEGEALYGQVFRYLRRRLGGHEDAEDVAATTHSQAWLKRHTYDPSQRLRIWLFKIATNKAIDLNRRKRGKTWRRIPLEDCSVEDTYPLPQEILEREEAGLKVREQVGKLPDPQRQVIYLFHYQGLTHRKIADTLGLSLRNTQTILYSARKRLGIELAPFFQEETYSRLPLEKSVNREYNCVSV